MELNHYKIVQYNYSFFNTELFDLSHAFVLSLSMYMRLCVPTIQP